MASGSGPSCREVEEGGGAELCGALEDDHTSASEEEPDDVSSATITIDSLIAPASSTSMPPISMTQSVLSLDGKGGWVVSSACDVSNECQDAFVTASNGDSTKGGQQVIAHMSLEEAQSEKGCTTAIVSSRTRKCISRKNRFVLNSQPSLCSASDSQPNKDTAITTSVSNATRQSDTTARPRQSDTATRPKRKSKRKLVITEQEEKSAQNKGVEEDALQDLSCSPILVSKRRRGRRKSSMIFYSSSDEDEADCVVAGSTTNAVLSADSRREDDLDLSCVVIEATTTAFPSCATGMRNESLAIPVNQSSSAPGPLAGSWAAIFRQPCTNSKDVQTNERKRHRSSPAASPKKACSPSRHLLHHRSSQHDSPLKGSPLLRKLRMISRSSPKKSEQDPLSPVVKKQLSFSSPDLCFDCAPYSGLLHETQSPCVDLRTSFPAQYPCRRIKSFLSDAAPLPSSVHLGSITKATEAVPTEDVLVEV